MNVVDQLEKLTSQGERVITLITRTSPKLLKKDRETGAPCPYREVFRINERTALIGGQYEEMVNAQLAAEGKLTEFRAESLWNGKGRHVAGSKFLVEHVETGKQYIAAHPIKNLGEVWTDEEGSEIDAGELKNYLPKPSNSNRQGTETEVPWRVFAIESVVSVFAARK